MWGEHVDSFERKAGCGVNMWTLLRGTLGVG